MLRDNENSVAWVLGGIRKNMAWVLGESDKQNKGPEKKTVEELAVRIVSLSVTCI